jgi:hypothetical protein
MFWFTAMLVNATWLLVFEVFLVVLFAMFRPLKNTRPL